MGQIVRSECSPFAPLPRDPIVMAERVMRFAPASEAEALKVLRASFPHSPLSARIAALAFLMKRPAAPAQDYSPR
jgi:hypothetical protein